MTAEEAIMSTSLTPPPIPASPDLLVQRLEDRLREQAATIRQQQATIEQQAAIIAQQAATIQEQAANVATQKSWNAALQPILPQTLRPRRNGRDESNPHPRTSSIA